MRRSGAEVIFLGGFMRGLRLVLIGLLASLLAVVPIALTSVNAAPHQRDRHNNRDKNVEHNLKSPMAKKQDALRQTALERKLKGDPSAQGKVAKVAKGQYVQLEREGTDRVFTIIAEFGNTRHPAFCDPGQTCQ